MGSSVRLLRSAWCWAGVFLCGLALSLDARTNAITSFQRVSGDTMRVEWLDADGTALTTADHMNAGTWRFAGSPDDWPVRSNWTVHAAQAQAVFRAETSFRGRIHSVEEQQTIPRAFIGFLLANNGITGITPVHDVTIYRLTYETFDHRRRSTLASGALCVPEGLATAPVISFQHGTIYERRDAPSQSGSIEQGLGVAAATEGYIALLPDYLGLGTNSPALHPYVHARSEAVACVDMLRAGVEFINTDLSIVPNSKLFLAGYSQGGHATLAFLKELELYHAAEFTVTACAPMAGPHDLSGVMRDVILGNAVYGSPAYLPYTILGMDSIYDLLDSPAEVFLLAYTNVVALFDGETSSGQINAALPSIPRQMLNTNFLASFESDTNNVFQRALVANDTWRGWVPATPLRFYHCAADTIVPVANSEIAVSNLLANGAADVSLFDPLPSADHTDCALPAFLAAKTWFDSL